MIRGEGDNPDQSKPFVEHLEDLRRTIIQSLCLIAVGIAIAVPLSPSILLLVKLPLVRADVNPETFLRVMRVAGGMSISMKVALWGGLLLSLPFVTLVVCRFVFPGLKDKEKKVLYHAGGFALALFLAGLAVGYFLALPVAVRMMLQMNDWLGVSCDFVELGDYVSFALQTVLLFGLVFEMPVVVVILGRLGILNSAQLRRVRRHVIVGLLIVAALLPPSDPITQCLLAGPLILLYELCIWLIWLSEKAKGEVAGPAGEQR